MFRILISLITLLTGLALLVGGGWLGVLGGSWFYFVLGLLVVISAGLLLARRPLGLGLFGAAILLTLAWALWEVGFDWWGLAARGGLLIALGILLLLAPIRERVGEVDVRPIGYQRNAMLLIIAVVVSGLVGGYSLWQHPHDMSGRFTAERMAAPALDQNLVPDGEWHAYGRTSMGQRFSPLDQITPKNVSDLQEVWRYQTGEVRGDGDPGETTYEVTPLLVDNRMFICTPFGTVIALDPVNGQELWKFDPQLQQPPTATTQHMSCRGVSYYDGSKNAIDEADANAREDGLSQQQRLEMSVASVTKQAAGVPQNIVAGEADADTLNPKVERKQASSAATPAKQCVNRLFAPTADGRLIALSAETGEICPGFGGADGTVNLWANMPNVTPGSMYSTSPPVVTDKVIVVGGAINDNASTTSPSGVIRAFDLHTGALVWNFDSKNPDAIEPIDEGEIYSSNSPNSWSISSYDPDLGLIYLPFGSNSPDQYGADRTEEAERFGSAVVALRAETGEVAWVFQGVHHDLWDYDMPAQPSLVDLTVNGQQVPALVQPTKQGDLFVLNRETGEPVYPIEERQAPTGAIEGDFTNPTQPASSVTFRPEPLQERDMWGATLLDQLGCRITFNQLNYEGTFTPPSTNGTLVYPGNFGTFNWGGVAIDPERQILFGMPVYLAFTSQMFPRPDDTTRVVTEDGEPIINENFGAPYAVRLQPLMSQIGLPCQQPPWGYIAAVDLQTGEKVYQHVNGTVRDLAPVPLPFEMGVPGIGGPIVTRGGMAFLSGTMDYYARGYDLATGEEVWRVRLPAGGQATPSTYLGADGRQYLVVVAGGHGSTGTKAGDSVIAYALPPGRQ